LKDYEKEGQAVGFPDFRSNRQIGNGMSQNLFTQTQSQYPRPSQPSEADPTVFGHSQYLGSLDPQ
jgi:hypothetical protein